ncbi:MAG: proline--tRNA ligase [Oscillospiraceae bacterium]|jgi:prolyl-tRNA synthetase|nr:proline--tRNA ligase [Oscillospiraceae bacterium]
MAEKRPVEQITPRGADFAAWYTDVVLKAELVDYTSVKGCIIYRPYAYALWENIQAAADKLFKDTGHENVYLPLLIPESLLQKEKDHVEGFAPEVAWVTHGGSEKLTERMCVRPTSETLFCEHYAHVVQSWRDLPKLYNQWCSVMRWEKTTRPFLRGREFLWQEGHTIHATAEEAMEETLRMLDVYCDIAENYLAMPVIKGRKTEGEKFAGAKATYSFENMMHDGKALQSGTTHYFGDGFAKAFDIRFLDKDNRLKYPHQTSWGISTRLIGGIIMTHGDDSGLCLPPRVAPVQVIIIPVASHKPGVRENAERLHAALKARGLRVKTDCGEQSAGWKFAEYEMKGVPLRIELGPRDVESGQCVFAPRTGGKETAALDGAADAAAAKLDEIQALLYARAKENLAAKTSEALTLGEMTEIAKGRGGFIKTMWCGKAECEAAVKEATGGMKSRCIPFEQERLSDSCAVCGDDAEQMLYWGFQY